MRIYFVPMVTKRYNVVAYMLFTPTLCAFDSSSRSFNRMFDTITLQYV